MTATPVSLIAHLARYAAYHRDRRNVLTHLIGIPAIVLAVEILLARPALHIADITVPLAVIASAAAVIFYLRLDVRFGLAMTVLLGIAAWAGIAIARLGTAAWLSAGIGLFVVGWIIQFVGHHYEGRKPAFTDDIIGLIIGPLFIVVEIAFFLGLRREVERAMAERALPAA